ncbi:MAG: protein phosphatase 2C domain-containing protein [Myxococcota bacterium]
MHLSAASLTTTGRRSNNEDAHLARPELALFAVADGMGGYACGEVASRIALDELGAFVAAVTSDRERTWPNAWDAKLTLGENLLDQAILVAHRRVIEARPRNVSRMGTTLAALYLDREAGLAVLGHVGDSRVYRWRAGELTQLTRDHSMVEELRASGAIGPDDSLPGMAHIVTRALGVEGWSRPTVTALRPEPGDRYLLCTDGLCGVLDADSIAAHLAYPSRAAAAERLVHAALEAGSNDNITAVVVGVEA